MEFRQQHIRDEDDWRECITQLMCQFSRDLERSRFPDPIRIVSQLLARVRRILMTNMTGTRQRLEVPVVFLYGVDAV
jgi:hypothetical protein